MSATKHWVRASRPLALGNLVPPIALGVAAASGAGVEVTGGWLGFCLAFAVLDLLAIVWANDVADEEADRSGERTLVSGGSGVLVEGLIARRTLGIAALVASAGLFVLTLVVIGSRPWMPLASIAALALLWAYSFPPLRVSYRTGGALLQALGVGVVLPILGTYAVAGSLEPLGVSALVGAFILGFASHLLTALSDRAGDARADKRSLAVRLGDDRTRVAATAAIVVAAMCTPWVTGDHVAGGIGIAIGGGAALVAAFVSDRMRYTLASLAVANGLLVVWIISLW